MKKLYPPIKPKEPQKTSKVSDYVDVPYIYFSTILYDNTFESLTISKEDLEKVNFVVSELSATAEDVKIIFQSDNTRVYFIVEKENPRYNQELLVYLSKLTEFNKKVDSYNKRLPAYKKAEKVEKQKQLEKDFIKAKANLEKLEKQMASGK